MNIDFVFLGIMISYCVSFSLLYTRKKTWNTDFLRWLITGVLFIIGLLGLVISANGRMEEHYLFSCLLTPLVYNIFDRLSKWFSEIRNGRDFYLWLRHSPEYDLPLNGDLPKFRLLDIVLSIVLLLIISFLPLIVGFWCLEGLSI